VEPFLETANVEAARLAPERVSAFLDELSRQEEPWKVRQAREAIRLYRYFEGTREGRQAEPDATVATDHTADSEWPTPGERGWPAGKRRQQRRGLPDFLLSSRARYEVADNN
jgi:hypothetical protein